MADDYATWRPQAEADWTSEDIEMLRRERDAARDHAERLGKAGEVYFAELRAEVRRLRGLLDELLADDAEAIQQYDESGDFIGCAFCGLVWGVDTDADDPETPYPHTADCVVTRARAVGSGTAAETGPQTG